MKFTKEIRYDVVYGILQNKILILSPFCLAIIFFLNFYLRINSYNLMGYRVLNPSFGDLYLHVYLGDFEFMIGEDTSFLPPILWLLYWSIYFFSLLRYPVENLCHQGQQLLIKNLSRSNWWFSKMIWVILASVYFHLIYTITLFICNIFISHYPFDWNIDSNVTSYILELIHYYLLYEGKISIPFVVILSNITIGIFLSMFQVLLSLMIKPIYGYISIIGFLIGSCFLKTSILFGNYMLLIRQETFQIEGLNSWYGIVIGIVGILYVIFLGREYFLDYDILPRE